MEKIQLPLYSLQIPENDRISIWKAESSSVDQIVCQIPEK